MLGTILDATVIKKKKKDQKSCCLHSCDSRGEKGKGIIPCFRD